MTQRHFNQQQMFDSFDQAEPIKAAPTREGFVHCEPCHGSGRRFDPLRMCEDCNGLGQQLAEQEKDQ